MTPRWPHRMKWIEGRPSRVRYVQGLARRWSEFCENLWVRLSSLPRSGQDNVDNRVVVSLTSFPERIDKTYYAIKSLVKQSVRPRRIVLWLSERQFPDRKLPPKFERLIPYGLEMRFTYDDLRSHKKYFYMLQEQSADELVITFDDDLIYDNRAIERLVTTHREFPDSLVVNRGAFVNVVANGGIDRHGYWRLYRDEGVRTETFNVIPSTGAGCLYPYGVMPTTTFDRTLLHEIAGDSDDIWIWYNALLSDTSIVKTVKESRELCEIWGSQKKNLKQTNDAGNANDDVLHRMTRRSPEIIKKLTDNS